MVYTCMRRFRKRGMRDGKENEERDVSEICKGKSYLGRGTVVVTVTPANQRAPKAVTENGKAGMNNSLMT